MFSALPPTVVALAGVILGIINRMSIKEVAIAVDGKMERLAKAIETASHAEGVREGQDIAELKHATEKDSILADANQKASGVLLAAKYAAEAVIDTAKTAARLVLKEEGSLPPKHTVLVVEDSRIESRMSKHIIESDSGGLIRADSVSTLADAITEQAKGAYDCMVIDLNLADSHGYDTFAKLRTRFPRLPIIVCTGEADHEPDGYIRCGAAGYFHKGDAFNDDALVACINKAVGVEPRMPARAEKPKLL